MHWNHGRVSRCWSHLTSAGSAKIHFGVSPSQEPWISAGLYFHRRASGTVEMTLDVCRHYLPVRAKTLKEASFLSSQD